MEGNNSELAMRVIQRHGAMISAQGPFRHLWQQAADYVMPRKGNIETVVTPGEQQNVQLYDTTAEDCANVFAAGVLSHLTPAGELWARLAAKPDAPQDEKDWLDECTERMMKIIHGSNFYLGWHEDLLDAGVFGTSDVFVEESEKLVCNFVNVPVGTFTIAENSDGLVDTLYRKFKWTARQCAEKWGKESLSKAMRDCLESQDAAQCDKEFDIIHAVYPREKSEVRDGEVVGKLRPIASVYVDVTGSHVIKEDGFYEMPHCCGRLLRSNGELYGRGPGVQALPEIKLLNRIERDLLIGLEKMVSPGWLMPEDSAYKPDNRQNGVTYWDASNVNNKPEQLQLTNRVDLGEQKTEQKRGVIREKFHVNMFQMLSNVDQMKREKTAYEVSQLVQEKLVLFSPLFARIVQEKLNPLIARVFGICARRGVFSQPPQSVIDRGVFDYEVEYVSRIALAIRAAENSSLALMMQLVTEMMAFDPSVVHVFDWRGALRRVSSNQGFPASLRRTDEQVDAIMAGIAQQQAMQQAPEAAERLAGAAQKLGPGAQRAAAEAIEV